MEGVHCDKFETHPSPLHGMQISGTPGVARVKEIKRHLVDVAKVQVVDVFARVVELFEALKLADL